MYLWKCLLYRLVCLFAIAGGSSAQAMTAKDFDSCIAEFKSEAASRGIAPSVIETSFAQVELSERVLELDRQQPEFTTTFADYFKVRVTPERVAQGRALLEEHRALLDRVAEDYGVAAPYLVAFWGLETNFGGFFGSMQVLDSLATLGCDPRRSDFFTTQLMAALRIIDEGSISAEQMEGSWAGAMGHVQFMPTVFIEYAVDYDGDGRRDLWHSLPDAMASAANFLNEIGWREGYRWGREVLLPENFPYLEAGLKGQRPLSEWAEMGVRASDGSPLPKADVDAALLVPAGHRGPAFLVYHNFKVIMGWNRSEFYGLVVGHLADRIAGLGRLSRQPPDDAPRLRRLEVIELQKQLNQRGFDAGAADGILGPATRRAISEFQHDQGMVADGFPSRKVLALLGVELADVN